VNSSVEGLCEVNMTGNGTQDEQSAFGALNELFMRKPWFGPSILIAISKGWLVRQYTRTTSP
jgi:hypothetical protein